CALPISPPRSRRGSPTCRPADHPPRPPAEVRAPVSLEAHHSRGDPALRDGRFATSSGTGVEAVWPGQQPGDLPRGRAKGEDGPDPLRPSERRRMSTKTVPGNYFEDFSIGQEIRHATPRTVTDGDIALYTGLYGSRFAATSAATFAESMGFARMPVDSLLTFHLVFGKSVPDISLNAVATLGYAGGRFGAPLHMGYTVTTTSTVIGLKQNSNGRTGVVYVNSVGVNQRGEMVVDYVRWVMVHKKDP